MKTALKRIISNLFTGIFQYDSARKFWSILGQTTRRNTEPRELVVSSEHGYLKHAPLSAYFQYTFRSTSMVSAAPRNYKIVKKIKDKREQSGKMIQKKLHPVVSHRLVFTPVLGNLNWIKAQLSMTDAMKTYSSIRSSACLLISLESRSLGLPSIQNTM